MRNAGAMGNSSKCKKDLLLFKKLQFGKSRAQKEIKFEDAHQEVFHRLVNIDH